MPVIDFNCDLGEGAGNDEAIMPFISSASIACGFHAGDKLTMHKTVELCIKYNAAIGAHPSFPDKENFGRHNMNLPPDEIYSVVIRQIEALALIAREHHKKLQHVKPHGALYNMAAKDIRIAGAVANAVKNFDKSLLLFGLPNSASEKAADNCGLQFIGEAFADRTYQPDGSLTPRVLPDALIEDETKAIQQVLQIVNKKTVTAVNGEMVPVNPGTICLHGDGKQAVQFAEVLHGTLLAEGITIQSFNT